MKKMRKGIESEDNMKKRKTSSSEDRSDNGPGLLEASSPGYLPFINKVPGLLGAAPSGCLPFITSPGLLGAAPPRGVSFTTQGLSLLGAAPLECEPCTAEGRGLLDVGPLECAPFTIQDHSLLGAAPISKGPCLMEASPRDYESFTTYGSRRQPSSSVPVQSLNQNLCWGGAPKSVECEDLDVAAGFEREPPWKSQMRELKEYVIKLENEKCQLRQQIQELKDYVVKIENENTKLYTFKESCGVTIEQGFKHHFQQLEESMLNLAVENVCTKLKSQVSTPNDKIQSTFNGNRCVLPSIQDNVIVNSEIDLLNDKSVDDDDYDIQIVEPVKEVGDELVIGLEEEDLELIKEIEGH